MAIRIQPAVSDPEAARAVTELLGRLPETEALAPATDSGLLLDALARQAAESVDALPEVVLVHELVGPLPALELIREVALRFPAVAVVLLTRDTGAALYSAAMDAGARGVVGLPATYEELVARLGPAATWAAGVRRHLGGGGNGGGSGAGGAGTGPGGTVVAVTGAKGGVGVTLTAVQLALAAQTSGRRTALVDMDLQAGDVASYLDVQFRRSLADLAGIRDVAPRVLDDAVYPHESGLALLLAPGEGERGEEVDDGAARQILAAVRARYEVVVVDCGTQMHAANTAAVETADRAVLVTTPDVVSVRGAKRMVRLWDRLRVRTADETVVLVNRASRASEIQPPLVARIVGTPVARTTVPAHYKELQSAVDAGRMQDLDSRSTVKQALWGFAGELGLVADGPGTADVSGPDGARGAAGTGGKGGTAGKGGPGGGGRGRGLGFGRGAGRALGRQRKGAGRPDTQELPPTDASDSPAAALPTGSPPRPPLDAPGGAPPQLGPAGQASGSSPAPVPPPSGPPGTPEPAPAYPAAGHPGYAPAPSPPLLGPGAPGQSPPSPPEGAPPGRHAEPRVAGPGTPGVRGAEPGAVEPGTAGPATAHGDPTTYPPTGPPPTDPGTDPATASGRGSRSPFGSDRGAIRLGRRPRARRGARTGSGGSGGRGGEGDSGGSGRGTDDDGTGRRRFCGERGAALVEFTGMAPVVLVVAALLWQCVLIGYTFSLAGNAADEAARAATAAAADRDPQSACRSAATAHLPEAWASRAEVDCGRSGHLWKADVHLTTPVLFPGAAHLPFTLTGTAGAAEEG